MLSLHMIYLLLSIIYASTNANPSCSVELIQNTQKTCTNTNIHVYKTIPNNDWATWMKLGVDLLGAAPIPGIGVAVTMTDFLIDSVTATDQNTLDLAFQDAVNAEFAHLKKCMDTKIINGIEQNEQREVTAVASEFEQLMSIFLNTATSTTFHAQYLHVVDHLLDLVLTNFALDSQFDTLERFLYYLPLFKATSLLYDHIITGFLLYLKLNNLNQDFLTYYTLATKHEAVLSLWIETAYLDFSNLYTSVELIYPTGPFIFAIDEALLDIINSTTHEQIISVCRTTLPGEPTACAFYEHDNNEACWIREGNLFYHTSFADWSTNFTNIYYNSVSAINNKLSDIRITECQIFGDNFGFESVSSGEYLALEYKMAFVSNNTNDTYNSRVFNEFNILGGSIVHSSGACLEYNYKSGYVLAQSCDETNIYQKWLFTTNGRIKTVFNDKCIENSDQIVAIVKDCTGKDNQKWLKKCCFKSLTRSGVCYFGNF